MEIKIISTDKPTTIAVIGRIDTVTAPDFQKQMEAVFEEHQQDLLLDCAELSFLSSAGLRALFMLARKSQAAKTSVTLQTVAPNVRDVLKISGFDNFFNIIE